MGHVSDFNGMNSCDETDLSQATSDLISADNILDSLQENFMPIYNSFPDDIYRHPNLYASSNLSSFITNDDDRNGYFDEPLELDLLFDSNSFNFDFGTSETISENVAPTSQNESVNAFNEENICETNGNISSIKKENEPQISELQSCLSQTVSHSDINSQQNNHCVDNCKIPGTSDPGNFLKKTTGLSELKTYASETAFKEFESSPVKAEQIKIEPESKCTENFYTAEVAAPMTIADNVKLGRRRNGNYKCDDSKKSLKKDTHEKHKKTHKRKSRHKKRHKLIEVKSKVCETNTKLSNCNTESFEGKNIFLNENGTVNTSLEELQNSNSYSSEFKIESNCQSFNNTIICFKKSSPYVRRESYSPDSDQELNSSSNISVDHEMVIKTESDPSSEVGESFQFDFTHPDSTSPLSSVDIKQEVTAPVEDFLNQDATVDQENIPNLNKSLLEDNESINSDLSEENSLSDGTLKEEPHRMIVLTETIVASSEPKSSSVSDLIEELNAHNQEVFKEIEISTPGVEIELNDVKKNSTDLSAEASHQPANSANEKVPVQTKTDPACGENDKSSPNHFQNSKNSSPTVSVFHSTNTVNHYSSTARPRNISSSSSSVTSKVSSTSHRCYRKRRRSSSSSSSSSDREKYYNRPVKYDPVTQTYCDEFGREIRPNALKYYLHSKSKPRDSHSNNGSSGSSRSKSPRYRNFHQKHHKSRSGSRSHRRRRYSSSRSRSRSHGRKYKDSDRRYRSPSPKHRSKRHYLEIEENMKAYEERRVMYVGDIPPDYTVEQLKDRFSRFGPIQSASIKSKITADGSLYIFGFVTFINRLDVCQAIERGNENPSWPRFDLNFGGRRRFCNGNYTDLDGKIAEAESGWYGHQNLYRQYPPKQEDDFAELLRQEQRRIQMSKK